MHWPHRITFCICDRYFFLFMVKQHYAKDKTHKSERLENEQLKYLKGDTPWHCYYIRVAKNVSWAYVKYLFRPLSETISNSLDHISIGSKGPPPLFWHHGRISTLCSHYPPQWGCPVLTWDSYSSPPEAKLIARLGQSHQRWMFFGVWAWVPIKVYPLHLFTLHQPL